jgi:glycosyltransferase involved in cell wall biosynthesis
MWLRRKPVLPSTDRRRILLFTDAWAPQVNGVVRTLETVLPFLRAAGHAVRVVHPGLFRTVPCPTYPDIRLATFPGPTVRAIADEHRPDAVHVATEGPIGLAARRLCLARRWPFTTSFHTRFPEYVRARLPIPTDLTWRAVRWFHRPATRVLVPGESMRAELARHGIAHTVTWSRGVDVERFRPELRADLGLPRPVHLYVGRVAVEKGLPAFLRLDLPGTKVVVGDGPARRALARAHPRAVFLGARHGAELARIYASADVFVFPSRTDTFGLVMLEALASGVPVAAFPVPGPLDALGARPEAAGIGAVDADLRAACARALAGRPDACRAHAQRFAWRRCALRLRDALEPIPDAAPAVPAASRPTRTSHALA